MSLSEFLGLSSSASWVDGYVQASFRGVKFFIRSATSTGGRKIVEHSFPERDDTYNEDLGKKNKGFSLSAYVVGDEYYNVRNDLEDALDVKGAGVLIHPYRGELTVKVKDFSISEETEEGRIARIDIQFINDADPVLTILGPGPFDLIGDAIGAFQAAALSFMGNIFEIANTPNAILDDLNSVVQVGLSIVDSSMAIMATDDIFQSNLNSLMDSTEELFASPTILLTEIQDLITYGTDINDPNSLPFISDLTGAELFSGMKGITDFQDTSYSAFPTITDVDGQLSKEMGKFFARNALSARAGLVTSMTIANANDADEIGTELDTLIRTVEEDAIIDDDMYAAARDLRIAVKGVINQRKLELSELVVVELSEFQPGIVLAHRLYQDHTRDEEIAELNDVIHPGFIPAGNIMVEES